MRKRNLVLIGFMGTGKSTVGRLCAARLGLAFRDSDALIESRAGAPVAQLFSTKGEAHFRQLEREVISELAGRSGQVIATGGGAVLDPDNAACLRGSGLVVLLDASPDAVLKRVGRAHTRPLLAQSADPRARIEALLAERQARYRAAAHCRVDTTDRASREVADTVVMLYEMTAYRRTY